MVRLSSMNTYVQTVPELPAACPYPTLALNLTLTLTLTSIRPFSLP